MNGKKIAIIGFGREGRAVYEFLKKHRDYKNAEIWILDKNPLSVGRQIRLARGVKTQLGKNYLKNLNRFDLIFRSPGVPYNQVIENCKLKIENSAQHGELPHRLIEAKITSATKLFFELCPCPIIGITGTKGKGTTATLLFNILKKCGRDVYLAGNIGVPALNILSRLKKTSLVVLELSSFQLQDLRQSPAIAAVLSIFPDHLDHHKNYREYIEAKKNIYRYQKAGDKVFFIRDCFAPIAIGARNDGQKRSSCSVPIPFSNGYRNSARNDVNVGDKSPSFFSSLRGGRPRRPTKQSYIRDDGDNVKWINKLKIPGEHNLKNAVMAYQVARYLNCPKDKIIKTILSFKGNEHRLELIKTIRGVKFYNDSASTNPLTTLAAVKSFKEPKILIAGGSDKGLDYKIWAKEFPRLNVKAIILFGENKEKIKRELGSMNYESGKIIMADNLKSAVRIAYYTVTKSITHDSRFIILLSPGAASFDMFKDYADRGQKFKKLVGLL